MIPQTPTAIRLRITRQTPNAAELGSLLRKLFLATMEVGTDVTIPEAQYRSALATAAIILGCSVQDLVDVYQLRMTP